MALRSVAVLIRDDLSLLEFGVTAEIFGIDRTDSQVPPIEFRVCSQRHGPVGTKHTDRIGVVVTHDLAGLRGADVVIVSATLPRAGTPDEVAAVRAAHEDGSVVVSLCTGAFLLAEAGLLDGRRATTHWRYADQFATAYPAVEVVPDELFVDHGDVITAAGTAAAIDTCLHLVRRELGQAVANTIARRMVVAPGRQGGQRQYVERAVTPVRTGALTPTLEWAVGHLDERLDVERLARQAGLSPRHLARRFVAEVGTTPLRWVTAQRIRLAQELLEASDLSIEQISHRVGYASATQLRHHFARIVGSTPARHRAMFQAARSH